MHPLQQRILELAKRLDLSEVGLKKMAALIEVSHPQRVKHHLLQLEKNGFVRLDEGKNRIAGVVGHENLVSGGLLSIPVLGTASCGRALRLAEESVEGYLEISPKALGKKDPQGLFAIKAVGDSLNRADIGGEKVEDGDHVIIDSLRRPDNGSYVLSAINGCANLKRFYKDEANKLIRLVSESTLDIPPIVLLEDDLESCGYAVNGVAVRVVKNQK